MKKDVLAFLKGIDDFENVPGKQLQWLIDHSVVKTIEEDDYLFQKGGLAEHLYIVLEGTISIFHYQSKQKRVIGQLDAGDIGGLLPYSRMELAQGFGQATSDTLVLFTHRDQFPEMIREHHELTESFVHQMTTRIRRFTHIRLQDEKLMALGKLSAGLAHELNNPASAIVRSSQALKDHLKLLPEGFKRVITIRMPESEVDAVNHLMFSKIKAASKPSLSVMERSELEDEIADWLEEHGVEDGLAYAETLVEFGFGLDDLKTVLGHTTEAYFVPVIGWIENNLTTEKMVTEIEEASSRIADLVGSVKGYTHMDRSRDRQPVKVREGLRSTLTMLQHKVRQNKVEVQEDLPDDLAAIDGFPGELNQVWTNLIDNALDAMEDGGGTLSLKGWNDREFVRVAVSDTGSGISEENQNQIFDPFFTTKEMGKGTGMGLEVVHKIVLSHKGSIKVQSEPGKTVFDLCFPAIK